MISYDAALTWVTDNWIALAVGVGFLILFFVITKRKKNKKEGSMSLEIYKKREQLREMDKLLEEIQTYFTKVENKLRKNVK